MPTNYPGAIDTFTDPNENDTMDGAEGGSSVFHDVQHANHNDAIIALENQVGVYGLNFTALPPITLGISASQSIALGNFYQVSGSGITLTMPAQTITSGVSNHYPSNPVTIYNSGTVVVTMAPYAAETIFPLTVQPLQSITYYLDSAGNYLPFGYSPPPQSSLSQPSLGPSGRTTSTSGVMMGLAGAFTPRATGKVLIIVNGGTSTYSGSGQNVTGQIRYGTGGAPANGAAATGTACSPANTVASNVSTTTTSAQLGLMGDVTGLTLGTAYWFDITLATGNASDPAWMGNVTLAIQELS